VLSAAVGDLDRYVEIVFREKSSQAVIDLMQTGLHHGEEILLSLSALSEIPEALDEHRDISWAWSLAQSLLPLRFVILWTGLIEWRSLLSDVVIQISSER
jgi:hypothetical protein